MSEATPKGVDPAIGSVIDGRYRITRKIGAGGMGSVYLATQMNIERDVAIKLLGVGFSDNDEAVKRFENEARIISQLRHPNTLKLIDFGRTGDGHMYIVTEFLSGAPLNRVLRDGTLSPARAMRVLAEICASLVEAHAKGIIHRDLKPANIFIERVGDEEVVKVLDFGIAKLSEQPAVTRTGSLFGTPQYMAPEQARGAVVDARADLYSLGVMTYECLAGRPPFVSDNMATLLVHHIMEPPPPIAGLLPGLHAEVSELVMSLLAKEPAARPPSAAELRRRAERLVSKLDAGARRSMPPGPASEQPTASDVSDALAATSPSLGARVAADAAALATVDALDAAAPVVAPKRSPALLVGAAVAVALVVGALFALTPEDPEPTARAIASPSPSPLASPSPSPSPLASPSPSAEAIASPSPIASPSAIASPSPLASPSPSPTVVAKPVAKPARPKPTKAPEASPPPGFVDVP